MPYRQRRPERSPRIARGGLRTGRALPRSEGQASSVSTILVPTDTGGPISVLDFKQNSATVVTANIPGYFFLSGGLDPSGTGAPYSTFFVESDGSFSITLLKEPISVTRREAEQELMRQLGASKNEMCALRYWVGVYKETNPIYANRNLGFSFCPGATELP